MHKQLSHTVIVIAGPTASGKTAVSVALAEALGTDIISADSRQCYQELCIGVARPSKEELAAVKHYFIASHSIHKEVNAGIFEQYALAAAEQIFQAHPIAVMTGGTGLYIKTFCEGMDDMPPIDPLVRQKIITRYQQEGMSWLQQELQQRDPAFWKTSEQQNPQRLMRALEILESTGRSITTFRNNNKAERPFRIIQIGLEISRNILYERINTRVDAMIAEGLVEEVAALYPYRHLNALQTVGYKELFNYMDGLYSLEEAVHRIKQNTRHYAKRQMTWFKKNPAIQWLDPFKNDIVSTLKAVVISE